MSRAGRMAKNVRLGPAVGPYLRAMTLRQGQVWKQGGQFIRITHLERLEVRYKSQAKLRAREGTHHHVSKKDFCRLLKGAVLLTPAEPEEPAE